MKRATAILLTATFLASACAPDDPGGGGSGGPSGKRWRLAASIDRLDNDYFVKIKQGIEARGKELGLEVAVSDARGSDDVQLQQLESFITQKFDAIVIAAVNDDVPAIEEAVKRARAAGIKVVAQSQRVKTADLYVSIRQHDYGRVGGRMAGAWIRDQLGGTAYVGFVGWPERPTIAERVEGLKAGLREIAPQAQFVAQIAAADAAKALTATEAVLQQWPEMRVIVAFNDDTGIAAANALIARFGERAGKSTTEFAVFGLDAIEGALHAIDDPKSPFRGTVDIDPFGNGRVDVDAAVALLEGKSPAGAIQSGGQLFLPVAMKPLTGKDLEKSPEKQPEK